MSSIMIIMEMIECDDIVKIRENTMKVDGHTRLMMIMMMLMRCDKSLSECIWDRIMGAEKSLPGNEMMVMLVGWGWKMETHFGS